MGIPFKLRVACHFKSIYFALENDSERFTEYLLTTQQYGYGVHEGPAPFKTYFRHFMGRNVYLNTLMAYRAYNREVLNEEIL